MDKNYELFVEQLKNGIHKLTGIGMENMIFFEDDDKLLVKFAKYENAWEACGLYVGTLFEQFEEKRPLNDIIEEIVYNINHARMSCLYDKTKMLNDYRFAKDRIIIRLFNKYSPASRVYVHKTIGDIALVACLLIADEDNYIITTGLPKFFLTSWSKSEDDIFEEALNNTYKLTPPRIYNLMDLLFNQGDVNGEDFMSPSYSGELNKGYVENMLSTTTKVNGAVAVFLPGVAERLAEILGTDFYMVFTSIHEVMIYADTYVDPYDLKNALVATTYECVSEEERLTSKIYKYVSDENKFICVTD